MKRRPSLKGRARFSDSIGAAESFTSTLTDGPRVTRRKQIERLDPAVEDSQSTWEWTIQGLDFTDRHQDS